MLRGIAVKGYRSFGEQAQMLPSLSKINLLIGKNNCGKSNILRLLHEVLPTAAGIGHLKYTFDHSVDYPRGSKDTPFHIGLWFDETCFADQMTRERTRSELLGNASGFWYWTEWSNNSFQQTKMVAELNRSSIESAWQVAEQHKKQFDRRKPDWYRIWRCLNPDALMSASGDQLASLALAQINPFPKISKQVDLIPAVRSVRLGENSYSMVDGVYRLPSGRPVHSGLGVIEDLQKAQNPTVANEALSERFKLVNLFVQRVTQQHDARIEVTHDRSQLLVHMNSKRLPLESLGTGIEEIIIIAARSTLFRNQIVCIEEPEIHLHPTLQRELMRYLHDHTDNQYFITTHSAHLIDATPCSVYHIELDAGFSKVRESVSAGEKFEICRDLGYHASDLFQSNCIVWVEGPSDRIYLRHWLAMHSPDLIEGLHYSIMFYGGRLLSHLSVNDIEVDDFISLRRLNRNTAIIIDSDRSKARQSINETKRRLRDEFGEDGGFCWVTAGREIENYVDFSVLKNAIVQTHKDCFLEASGGQYDKVTEIARKSRGNKGMSIQTIDKVKVAHRVTSSSTTLDILDLRKQIEQLTRFIRRSNENSGLKS